MSDDRNLYDIVQEAAQTMRDQLAQFDPNAPGMPQVDADYPAINLLSLELFDKMIADRNFCRAVYSSVAMLILSDAALFGDFYMRTKIVTEAVISGRSVMDVADDVEAKQVARNAGTVLSPGPKLVQ